MASGSLEGTANPPAIPSCPHAARKQEQGQELANQPFNGALAQIKTQQTKTLVQQHFTSEPKFENEMTSAEAVSMYQALSHVLIKCRHCSKVKCRVSVEASDNETTPLRLKKWNTTILIDHLAKECNGIDRDSDAFDELCRSPHLKSKAWADARERQQGKKRQKREDAARDEQQREMENFEHEREKNRLNNQALRDNDERQKQIDSYIQVDPAVSSAQFDVIMWCIAVFCFMCRIPFAVFDSFWFRQVRTPRVSKVHLHSHWHAVHHDSIMTESIFPRVSY